VPSAACVHIGNNCHSPSQSLSQLIEDHRLKEMTIELVLYGKE
jgi:hypothetical protein